MLQTINEGGFVESFASDNLARIRRKIQENEVQVRDILQDILKTKGDMLVDQGSSQSKWSAMFCQLRIHFVIGFQAWYMIFLLVEIQYIYRAEGGSQPQ